MFCEVCHAWTEPAVDHGASFAYCDVCGAEYECGECGSQVRPDGTCHRRTCLNHDRGD